MVGVSRGKMPSPFNKQYELRHVWLMAAVAEDRGEIDASRAVNLPHPYDLLFFPSGLSESSLETDAWLVSLGETIVFRAFTIAGARASASAGARASASAGARAAASTAFSNDDACDTVRAGEIRDAIRAAVIASSVPDAAFGYDAVSISSLRSASTMGSIRSRAACSGLVVIMISFSNILSSLGCIELSRAHM